MMEVYSLEDMGETYLIRECERLKKLNHPADKRNREWFDILPNTYDKYPEWFFLWDTSEPYKERPVAFSTIQQFSPGEFRLFTRTYIYPEYRRFTSPKNDLVMSPTMIMLPHQLNYVNRSPFGYKSLFVTMQGLNRSEALFRFGEKLSLHMGKTWIMPSYMVKTCNVDKEDCWQNIVYTGAIPRLEIMEIEEWKRRFQQ